MQHRLSRKLWSHISCHLCNTSTGIPLFLHGFLAEYKLHRSSVHSTSVGCCVCHVLQFASGHILRVSSMRQSTMCSCISGFAPAICDASIWSLIWIEYRCYEVSPDLWAGRHWTGTVRYRSCIPETKYARIPDMFRLEKHTYLSTHIYIYIYKFWSEPTRL